MPAFIAVISLLAALLVRPAEPFAPAATTQQDRRDWSRLAAAQEADEGRNTWRSAIRTPTAPTNTRQVVLDLCEEATVGGRPDGSRGEKGLAFLSVSQHYAPDFRDIVSLVHETLGGDYTLLSIVGGGVVGDGSESDDPRAPAMSLLAGVLPAAAGVEVFCFGPDGEKVPPRDSPAWNALGRRQDVPSYVVLADPFGKVQEVVDGLDSSGNSGEEGSGVVAGGISCPVFGDEGPTVGIDGRVQPRGSVVGVGLSGAAGLQAVVAQGCRPLGSLYEVTKAQGNFIEELDGRPAVEVLGEIGADGSDLSQEDKESIKKYGIMVGLATPGAKDVRPGDYLVRQILGFRAPSVMIGAEARTGDLLKFHVRDPNAALRDMEGMVGRAKTERMFSSSPGRPLAVLQISCVARGRSLFGRPNVDVGNVRELLPGGDDDDGVGGGGRPAIGGFYANGEIGPTGVAGVGIGARRTHMHGFTTVACVISDFGSPSVSSTASSGLEADVEKSGFGDDSAWG